MCKVLIIGIKPPHIPFLHLDLERPSKIGSLFGIGDVVYEVYKVEPENPNDGQLQNVYVKPYYENKEEDIKNG